jgi:ribosomal protein L29
VARSKAINNMMKLNKVYALSKFKTMIARIKTIRNDVSILTTVSLRIIFGK